MKPELAASLAAAILIHALVLFGFRMETSARPLAMAAVPPTEEVNLVKAPPAPASSAQRLSTPEPTPAPPPAAPLPTPDAMPPPDMPTQPPAPSRDKESIPASTPTPKHTKPIPYQKRNAVPHPPPGTAASLAGTAGHGAPGGASTGARANYLSNPRPDYPEEAKQMHQQGIVYLDVLVDADGRPNNVSVSRSSGYSLLDHAAVEAVRRWSFEPARAGGLAVSSRVEIPVRFSLSD